MFIRFIRLAAVALVIAIPLAQAEDYAGGAVQTISSDKGEVLTDSRGMTLYTFDKDGAGVSNCYDSCAVKWPPLTATKGAEGHGDYTLVKRKDGSMQWAYKGMPLYLWQADSKPGDMSGDGKMGLWHVATE